MHGTRLLRVFCNINPDGKPRLWRVGEPFAAHARRYLASFTRRDERKTLSGKICFNWMGVVQGCIDW